MHNAAAVRYRQRFRDINPNLENLGQRQPTIAEFFGESFPFQKLHHQKIGAVLRADVVKLADMRMVQRRDGSRLALHALLQFRR
jgi:hypothetical protein